MVSVRKMLTLLFLLAPLAVFSAEKKAPEKKDVAVKFPLPNPSEIGAEKFSLLLNAFLQQGGYESWKKDLRPRATGPFFVRDSGLIESFGTHGPAAVKVCYSPEVWEWMQQGRKGVIADGGIILKLLYARDPNDLSRFSVEPTGFSVMVKDSKGSWDGWFYSDGGPLTSPVREDAATFFDPNAGFAHSCINCHASADNPEGTYSSLKNVTDPPVIDHRTSISANGLKKGVFSSGDIHAVQDKQGLTQRALQEPAPYWNFPGKLKALLEPKALPISTAFDHVPQGPRPDGHRAFVTASNCLSCHDAVQLNATPPNMLKRDDIKTIEGERINLSPGSEWRHSMMSLAGRDPVFFAQLESERALHPELAAQIDNTCLSCHAVMGQRQWKKDHGADAMFSHASAQAEPGSKDAVYGALSRDGVSCVVCHQMQPEGLGAPATYSGKFALLDKPREVYGPYEKVATLPMEQAMGLTPKLGAHISNSNACASCHTIVLPTLDPGRKYSAEEFKQLADASGNSQGFHEQTTYLEWKNSGFSTEGSTPGPRQQSCQSCHMPKKHGGEKLNFRVANIEDETYPPVDNRAADSLLHLESRDQYSRHALHGINLVMLEMFSQNPWLLGVSRKNNLSPAGDVKPGFDVARESAQKMAQEETAAIKILATKREGKQLVAKVEVTNLTGHKFPTGVNFRRAFIEFHVKSGEKTVWVSGATDKWGVIGNLDNGKFVPLQSEFFSNKEFQPHHEKITREDQVQIYEELVTGRDGNFTTSFLSLQSIVKDNRLLPYGWNAAGVDVEHLRPTATGEDADYRNGEGKDMVTYEIPLDVSEKDAITVTATLFYQPLPPFYLRRLFEQVDQPDTQRLYYLINQLDLEKTAVREWKLKICQDQKNVE